MRVALAPEWDRAVSFIAALVALTDDVVVVGLNTTEHPDGDYYVQLCQEDGGDLTVEAVSNTYLEIPLDDSAISHLHSLGFNDPIPDEMPNYFQHVLAGDTSPAQIAQLLVRTLELVYGATPEMQFQLAPHNLVESLLRGEFGEHLAYNRNRTESQRARRYMGLRFDRDLNPL